MLNTTNKPRRRRQPPAYLAPELQRMLGCFWEVFERDGTIGIRHVILGAQWLAGPEN